MTISRRTIRWTFVLALACSLLSAGPVLAQCDSDTNARLQFLEQSLEGDRNYAKWWTRSWYGVYGIGTVVGFAQGAGLGDNDGPERAIGFVTAGKAMLGAARLYWWDSPGARFGADEMRAVPMSTQADCERRLLTGEKALMRNAKQADRRWDWRRHAGNVGVNGIGMVIGGAISGHWGSAGASAGLGLIAGAANIFTFPWQSKSDWDAYKTRFGGTSPRTQVNLVPTANGAAIQITF